jgi:hypothetical protein
MKAFQATMDARRPHFVLSLARSLAPIAPLYDRIIFDSAPETTLLSSWCLPAPGR